MPIYLYMNKELVVYLAFKGAINDTDEYVALRLEDEDSSSGLHNVVIAPHSKLRGSFDGAIFQDGTMVKVSAQAPVWVNFAIWRDKKGKVKYIITDRVSYVVDVLATTGKFLGNNIVKKDYNYSGVYFNQNLTGAKLNKWWKTAIDDCKKCKGCENLVDCEDCEKCEAWKDWKQFFETEPQKELREKLQGTL